MMICAVCISAQEVTENRGFKALLNGKIAVEVFFQTAYYNGEWQTAGYIYYPKAKSPAPILIVRNWGKEKPIISDESYHGQSDEVLEIPGDARAARLVARISVGLGRTRARCVEIPV